MNNKNLQKVPHAIKIIVLKTNNGLIYFPSTAWSVSRKSLTITNLSLGLVGLPFKIL